VAAGSVRPARPATLARLPREGLRLGARLLDRRWWWVTLAVCLICFGLARLGVWQLDRLAERRGRSAALAARLAAPPLSLTAAGLPGAAGAPPAGGALGGDGLAYRRVTVRGTFDYGQELGLVNQVRDGRLGFRLLTPLVLEADAGGAGGGPGGPPAPAVLVDRGWVPADVTGDPGPGAWTPYREAGGGPVVVSGWIHPAPAAPAPGAGGGRLPGRLVADLDPARLQQRVDRPLLPLLVVQAPEGDGGAAPGAGGTAPGAAGPLPYRQRPNPDLGDGVHLIAAAQWFAFALIGAAGYVVYVARYSRPSGRAK
jgi:surfeit locus 1 family protein